MRRFTPDSGRGDISMNLSHLLTASLAAALVCFIGGAEASPHFQSLMVSPLTVQAGLKCGLVNGQVVCGNTSGGKHHHDDDDRHANDDDHHHKKKDKDNSKSTQSGKSEKESEGTAT